MNMPELKPNDFSMDEDRLFMTLYNVWNRAKRAEKVQRDILEVEQKRLDVEIQINNNLLELIKLEKRRTDKGGRRVSHGTVSAGSMVTIDTTENPHKVKGYWFKNDGPDDVLFGVNVSPDGVTIEEPVLDVDTPGVITVKAGEIESSFGNEDAYENFYIKALGAPTDYRLKLTW